MSEQTHHQPTKVEPILPLCGLERLVKVLDHDRELLNELAKSQAHNIAWWEAVQDEGGHGPAGRVAR